MHPLLVPSTWSDTRGINSCSLSHVLPSNYDCCENFSSPWILQSLYSAFNTSSCLQLLICCVQLQSRPRRNQWAITHTSHDVNWYVLPAYIIASNGKFVFQRCLRCSVLPEDPNSSQTLYISSFLRHLLRVLSCFTALLHAWWNFVPTAEHCSQGWQNHFYSNWWLLIPSQLKQLFKTCFLLN